jgi:hypothetical protein
MHHRDRVREPRRDAGRLIAIAMLTAASDVDLELSAAGVD